MIPLLPVIHPEDQSLNGDGATSRETKEVRIYFKCGFSLREKLEHPGYRKELVQVTLWHKTFSDFLVNFLLHFLVYFHVRTWKGSLKPFDPEQRDTSKQHHCRNKLSIVTKLIPSEASVGPKTLTLAELGQYSKAARGFVPFMYFKNINHKV